MKKLFLAMIVCAGFCACSNDDVVVTTNPSDYSREAAAYLTVNIKDVNSGTRATSDSFAYGTEAEQTVNNAYFYFYDENGNYMANGSLASISGTAQGTAGETSQNGNIEWKSGTVVAVYGLDADATLPTQMLTVLNKPTSVNLQNKSLEEATATLAGTPWGDTNNGFVMSTSTYMVSSAVVNTTALSETDFALEPINLETDYAEGGVDVYVERLASKVGVDVSSSLSTIENNNLGIYPVSDEVLENFPMGAPTPENAGVGGLGIQLLGFDVDCVARDAYVSKQIATTWNFTGFTWNDADDYRSYWAESPNYGVEHTYPTSSLGNTDADEDTTPLDEYLRYVDLKSPVALGSTTYCGENTNTTDVISAADNSGLTNVLVKAQFGDYNPNNQTSPFTGIDLVEFHGEYYTAADFCQKCVDDVVDYDFTVLVDEVIAALKEKYTGDTFAKYLTALNNAVIHDHIYKSPASITDTKELTEEDMTPFGGEMLSLYNDVDGYVKIYYNMTTQPQWGSNGDYTNIDPDMAAKYPAEKIVYGGVDLDDYNYWFHVDKDELDGAENMLGLVNLLVNVGEEYYMPIDNSISFTTQAMGDSSFTGNHTYTTRNFLLRSITVECDGIDTEFGSHEPNFFADGLMYYHVPIEHLNTTEGDELVEGEYGVVRNHWYNVTITSLEGLGRGIAWPDEVIVPLPDVEYYYLGADINILSWKMVEQEVGF